MSRSIIACLAACVLVSLMPSCVTNVDPDYYTELARVKTDCQGDEIVGVWVSASQGALGERWRNTMLLRADGTGRMRAHQLNLDPKGTEWTLQWKYSGDGVWQQTGVKLEQTSNFVAPLARGHGPPTLRWTGSKLLREESWSAFLITTTNKFVWVRAEDEAALAEHVRRR